MIDGFEGEADASQTLTTDESSSSGTEHSTDQNQEFVTPEEDGSAENASGTGADEGEKLEPFHNHPRWKEVQAELAQLRAQAERASAFEPVLADLERSGFKSAADFQRAQEAQIAQQSQANKEQQEREAAGKYWNAVNVEFVDEAEARRLYALDMRDIASNYRDWETTQREQRLNNIEKKLAAQDTESQISTLTKTYPNANVDLLKTLANVKGVDLEQVARTTHTDNAMAVAKYNTKKTTERQAVAPEGTGGSPPPRKSAMPDPIKEPKKFDAWYQSQLDETIRLYGH